MKLGPTVPRGRASVGEGSEVKRKIAEGRKSLV